jgi:hypothetical protein
MGMDSFAPGYKKCGAFIVRNITPTEKKTINIFRWPIPYMKERDLLQIPGVAEDDIRASLLKGEIRHKFLCGDIELVYSDIDLLQFSNCNLEFLQSLGFTTGIQIGYPQLDGYVQNLITGGGSGGITPTEHETLRQLIHFVDEGPGDGFASGAFKESLPNNSPFPTSITWYLDVAKTKKLVEKLITYTTNKFPSIIQWNMYDFDGITIIHTVTDAITYTTAFESTRTRTIS